MSSKKRLAAIENQIMKYILLLALPFLILSCDNSETEENAKSIEDEIIVHKKQTITVRTKFDNEVVVEYEVYYRGEKNFSTTDGSFNLHINQTIIDSLQRFDMYEMYIPERETIGKVIENIIRISYPKIEKVKMWDVTVPDEALKRFTETDELRRKIFEELSEVFEKIISLEEKLETNKDLSNSEILEIEKELEVLEKKKEAISEEGRTYKHEYEL